MVGWMYILGLSGLAHDSAAALLGHTGILAAMEESKLGRSRRLGGIPRQAIQLWLEKAGIGWRDVPYVAVASRPRRAWARQAWLRARLTPFAPVPSGYYQSKALGELGRELNNLRLLKLMAHAPGSCLQRLEHHLRLHVVEREANPLLWQLLKRFGEHAPAPLLVNTSFNLFGEPLVITPRDAVRSYCCSGIDALIIGNFSLTKS